MSKKSKLIVAHTIVVVVLRARPDSHYLYIHSMYSTISNSVVRREDGALSGGGTRDSPRVESPSPGTRGAVECHGRFIGGSFLGDSTAGYFRDAIPTIYSSLFFSSLRLSFRSGNFSFHPSILLLSALLFLRMPRGSGKVLEPLLRYGVGTVT